MNKLITRNLLLVALTISVFIFSCRKNDIQIIIPNNSNPDLVTKVTTAISGFVTNENDEAMSGAIVRVGSAFLNTDQFGYFEIKNVEVNETAATFNVSKNGYFKLTKTFMAKEGKSAFFRIKLTRKESIGTIDAASGGDVSLSNGTTISLPADGVKNASTGVSYTGSITVSAHYIDPTAADIAGIMPGDLRGLRTNGDLNVLDSYGMLEVELTGASGELLQIADGKKATLTMAIPSSLTATAPATIPLWYFDEATGLWKEEGSANKVGNQYVGEVAHFSTWNCDNPHPHVPYHCRLVYSNGSPAANVEVVLSEMNYYGGGTNHGFTDANGEIFGGVQANAQVRMEVRSGNPCNINAVYESEFFTGSQEIDLGNIQLPNLANITAHIHGLVKDCNGNNVTNGRILFSKNGFYECHLFQSNGAYDFLSYLCSGNINTFIFAQDLNNNSQGDTININLTIGENQIPDLTACGNVLSLCNQVWITKNLNADRFRNGDLIPQITNDSIWVNATYPAWCWYNNDSTLENVYGKLYNWYAVNDSRGLAPQGWHIPNTSEWINYFACQGGDNIAGGRLKAISNLWASPNTGATNESGFTGLPGGLRETDGAFGYLGNSGVFWSYGLNPDARRLSYYSGDIYYPWFCQKNSGFSVRCIKD
jgi:uncharacterized protein (TIGR02145 family)